MAKLKVLVVEDENIIGKDIQLSLKKLGYAVPVIVNSGEKAIEEIERSQPDVVIMDIMLAGEMSGIDTANAIRERYSIPVIFLSAYADDNTLKKAKIAEPYGYIIKPYKDKELQTVIEVAIYKHEKDSQTRRERDLYHSLVESKESKDCVFIRSDFRLNKIKFDDIYFVEAQKDYVIINTSQNSYTTHATMKEMMRILPEKEFVRVQRSFIVRLDKIFSIKYPNLVIEGKMTVIPIGGLYRKELFNKLNLM
jgi:two-component system, LytTR family, response regulator LytT